MTTTTRNRDALSSVLGFEITRKRDHAHRWECYRYALNARRSLIDLGYTFSFESDHDGNYLLSVHGDNGFVGFVTAPIPFPGCLTLMQLRNDFGLMR